ncbi:MAG: nickel-dependent hydrogenase large subunit, partial [Methylobacter sp.]|nr:nickel-dependent hydrogenase large subunit [Methylobacter sp.]
FKLDSRLDIEADSLTRLIDELEALIDTTIFNGRLADFQALSNESQLHSWLRQNNALPAELLNYLYSQDWGTTGQNEISCLPELDPDSLSRQLLQEDLTLFSRTPHWQGRCYESTLFNRQLSQPLIAEMHGRYGNGLIVRILARLLELALIPSQLRKLLTLKNPKCSDAYNNGIGLAQVQAARGLLIHRLELRQGRIHDYRIVAPTEWNFHPKGVVAQGLKQLTAANPNDLKQQAELYINAVDPCVQYALHLSPQS